MGYADLTPTRYVLKFEPDFEKFTFDGTAYIHVKCVRPTKVIEMDCSELRISACRVFFTLPHAERSLVLQNNSVYGGGKNNDNNADKIDDYAHSSANASFQIPLSSVSVNDTQERLTIHLPHEFKTGTIATIQLDFKGILNDRLLGFYHSSYQDCNNNTRHLATTQFEAADARRAFPCWDRPDAKATFEIQLVVSDKHYTAISNMPVAKIKNDRLNKKRIFYFNATPRMSTYLVYMGVGEFSHVQSNYNFKNRTVKIRIITTTAVDKKVTKLALVYAKKLLGLYESYFKISYPLPKLDLIAIPDFAAGAMENWGAITFRENLLLFDEKTSSARTKQLIAEVISHEIAHQWFGNLVTMKWWNDLWLNESFATFMATKLLDQMHPEWELWKQFLTGAMKVGMELDSLHSTHPIDVPVKSPAQIREIFDPISYDKGGCVLRMLEHYVGEKSFRKGLIDYLKKYQYDNARGEDLWRCIEKSSSNKPVLKMMNSWLSTLGFPVVHLKMKKQKTAISARQERFMHDEYGTQSSLSSSAVTSQSSAKWVVPLSIKQANKNTSILFSTRSIDVPVQTSKSNTNNKNKTPLAIIGNPGRTGFYRVHYDHDMLLDVMTFANKGLLDTFDLWALQNDMFAMCMLGKTDVRDYLSILEIYCNVDDYSILLDIGLNMSRLYMLSFGTSFADEINQFAFDFHKRIHDTITGWSSKRGETHAVSLLRAPVISSLGRLGDLQIIEKCRMFYEQLHTHNEDVLINVLPPDVIETVCTVVAWNCKSKSDALAVYKNLVAMHARVDTTEKKMRFASAMCGFQYSDILLRALHFALSDNVRSQNFFILVARVAANPHAFDILWPWIQKNWKKIANKAGHGNPLLGRIISSLANTCTLSDIPQIKQFFAANPTPGTERTLLQTIERIQITDKIQKRMKKEFKTKTTSELQQYDNDKKA